MRIGFICSNYYAFPAFRQLLGDSRLTPTFVVGLDETRFAESGMRPFYYQGSRYFAYALGHGVPSFLTTDLNRDGRLLDALIATESDYVFAMGWPDILTDDALRIGRGILGIHPSRLPAYRGGAPLNWQLLDGMTEIGVTAFFFAPKVDAGRIVVQRDYAVPPGNAATLIEDVYERATLEVFDAALDKLAAGEGGDLMDPAGGFYRPRRTPADGAIDFDRTVEEVVRFVVAQTFPFPAAFVVLAGMRFLCNAAVRVPGMGMPGEVVAVSDSELVVACSDGAVRLGGIVGGDLGRVGVGSRVEPV